jgi:uncharacterized protein (DUF924 family)
MTIKGPPDLSYCDILNLATDEAMAKDALVKKNPIRPSGSGACTRELAYKLMEFTGQADYGVKPITAELNRIFSSGHALEYDIVKQFRKYTSDIFQVRYTQQSMWFEKITWPEREDLHMMLEGSNDLVFWSPEWKCVADIKTKKDKFSSWMASNWSETTDKLTKMKTVQCIGDTGVGFWIEDLEAFLKELNDPFFEANFLQLNLYATHPEFVNREVDHACIIQYNKNDQRLREVRFAPSQALADKVRTKFNTAIKAADAGQPEQAPRDYMLGSIKCAFCDFKKECWPEPSDPSEDPLKAYFKTLPKKHWAKRLDDFDTELAEDLRVAYEAYCAAESSAKDLQAAEELLAKLMLDRANTWKLKMDDGQVLLAKNMRSPKPHITIRRGKE